MPDEAVPALRPPTEAEKGALRSVLGVRVAAARKRLGLSQRAMARECGMSGTWARGIELGSQFAPAWLIAMLAEAAGWQVGWFYGFGSRKIAVEESADA